MSTEMPGGPTQVQLNSRINNAIKIETNNSALE